MRLISRERFSVMRFINRAYNVIIYRKIVTFLYNMELIILPISIF